MKMKIKISKLEELGFEEVSYMTNAYILPLGHSPYNIYSINIWYNSTTNNFTLNGILLNIKSISELKTFLNFFVTKE